MISEIELEESIANLKYQIQHLSKSLKEQTEMLDRLRSINQARQVLRNNGYFVDNLWHIQDVQIRFKCDDKTAMVALKDVFTCDVVKDFINTTIFDFCCRDMRLEEVEDNA